jgi:hypothetical protein
LRLVKLDTSKWSDLGHYTVAEIYKAFWFFWGIASPDCSGFKNQSHFFGVARSTYVGSPFRNTSRVGGGVEMRSNALLTCQFSVF